MSNSDFEIISDEFKQVIAEDSKVEIIAEGLQFTEGPVWVAEKNDLFFSDIYASRLMSWSEKDGLRVEREPTDYANGNALDRQGRLITCGHVGGRRVTRTERDGAITVLCDRYNGLPINSPNDVVVKSDDTIWFTDPPFTGSLAVHQDATFEQPKANVFRIDPGVSEPRSVADDFEGPNGLCFSPDEGLLYVVDSTRGHIRVYDVTADNALSNGRLFCEVDRPDGIRTDTEGRLYATAEDGVRVFNAAGDLIGKILAPHPANCAFGGSDRGTLFMTARSLVLRTTLAVSGADLGA